MTGWLVAALVAFALLVPTAVHARGRDRTPHTTRLPSGVPASSPSTTVTLPTDTSAPSVPSLAATYVGCERVALAWTAARDDGPSVRYELWLDSTLRLTTAATTGVVGDLACSTSHTFAVRAIDAAGNASAFSAALTVTTAQVPQQDTLAPSTPTHLTVLDGYCGDVLVVWEPSSDDRDEEAGLSYEVYVDGVLETRVTGQRYANVVVDEERLHSFAVVAVDRAGNASAPAHANVETGACE